MFRLLRLLSNIRRIADDLHAIRRLYELQCREQGIALPDPRVNDMVELTYDSRPSNPDDLP